MSSGVSLYILCFYEMSVAKIIVTRFGILFRSMQDLLLVFDCDGTRQVCYSLFIMHP